MSDAKTTLALGTEHGDAAPTPEMRMFFRTPTATLFGNLSNDGKDLNITATEERSKKLLSAYASAVGEDDGTLVSTGEVKLCRLSADGVLKFNDGETAAGQVQTMELSPRGSLIVTWSKPNDLILRRNSSKEDKEILMKLVHKKVPSGETLMQFTKSDAFACYQVTNEVRIWDTRKLTGEPEDASKETMIRMQQACRVRLDGLASYSVCPESGSKPEDTAPILATFQIGKSGMPSSVSLFAGEAKVTNANLFRADFCTYKWNPFLVGDVLAKLETSVDATGQSYYGESKLVLLSHSRRQSVEVVCGKEGAVHDFAWSPRRHVFVVVAGKSPARCTLFDGKTADPLFEYGETHKNIACFSPSGRFLCLAGFGNLAGGMDFWDVKKNKLLGSGKADAAVGYGWAPSGRIFMTATLAPRMNVDNGVTFYTYRGEKISHFRADDKKSVLGGDGLLECKFLPVGESAFPDLPPTPKAGGGDDDAKAAPPTEKKVGVYRPPGATALTSKISEEMRGNRQQATAVKKPQAQAQQATQTKPKVPGASPATTKAPAAAPKPQEKPKPTAQPAPAAAAQEEDEEKDPEKRLRKVKKLLRQIEEIEQKGGPKDDAQKAKLSRKKDLEGQVKELEELLRKTSV